MDYKKYPYEMFHTVTSIIALMRPLELIELKISHEIREDPNGMPYMNYFLKVYSTDEVLSIVETYCGY